ncbi:MAG: transglutaminase-like cysteine peptidase [Campylobacterota bacterium]|nr:transglutaminase-like cysteine peptidase [Campylobacterota bacterium]
MKSIEKNAGRISKFRIIDYQNKIDSFKLFTKEKKLLKVNFYLNQLLPQYDDVTKKQEDYWATPKEFLILGYGDCEDYAIIKYYTLIKLGFDKNKLFLTTAHEKYRGGYHMVLSYFKSKNEPPLILDNLSFRVLTLKKRKDLEADLFINHNGIFKLKKNGMLKKIAPSSKKFNNMLYKVSKE